MSKHDKKKFSIVELFNNNSGKTSGSAFAGLLISVVGALTFLTGVIYQIAAKVPAVMDQSVIVMGIGSALLGVNKVIGSKETETTEAPTETKDPSGSDATNQGS